MAGISGKAANFGLPENKIKYNGIEFESDLDLIVYDAFYRELDPQTGKWWEIDPKTEEYYGYSVYSSNNNNPISFSDPLGDEGTTCCDFGFEDLKNIAKSFTGTAAGFLIGTTDNLLGTNIRGSVASTGLMDKRPVVATGWNIGLDAADVTAISAGGSGLVAGPGLAAASVDLTVVSGGLAIEVSGPGFISGVGITYVSSRLLVNGSRNLGSQNGKVPVNSNGSNTSSSSKSKVQKESKPLTPIGDKYTKKVDIKPGKGPGQSRSEYVRFKNKNGKVIRTYKDSYDRANKFKHRKPLRGGPEGRPN